METNNFNDAPPFNVTVYTKNYYCEHYFRSVTSKGIFQGDDPMNHSFVAIMVQLGTAILMTTLLRRILQPFNQPRFIPEMLTGIMLGPSIVQHFNHDLFFRHLYTAKHEGFMSFFEFFSVFMFEYMVGMQTDLNIIKSSGRLGWILGISAFAFPNILSKIVSTFLKRKNPASALHLDQISMFSPITSFHVTVILLQDVKLLNSEIGRLAITSSIISNICGWLYTIVTTTIMFGSLFKFTTWDYIKISAPRFLFILIAASLLKSIMVWMMKKVPEGKSLKQWQFVIMILMIYAVGFINEMLGYTGLFGAVVLGMIVPAGPPLGSGMVEKVNLVITGILVPFYFLVAGNAVNVFLIKKENFVLVTIIVLSCTVGKILAAVVPMKYFGVPNKDAFALGLILCSQGFFDVMIAKRLYTYMQITQEYFTIITLMIMLNSLIATPILRHIYDPSKRYINYKRRTIQHLKTDEELKTVVCIHEEDDVFGIMNVLRAIHSTRKTPLTVYILDLMELIGRNTPIFMNHQYHQHKPPTATTNRTDRIISAFRQFQSQFDGLRRYNYTVIAPYNSMHDEICTLALNKSASLLIVPFHRSETIAMRGVKRNVLDKAPCSVGFLVDKRILVSGDDTSIGFNVCVPFLGGPDAREALALAMRMMEHPNTSVSVLRLIAEDEFVTDLLDTKLDIRAIMELESIYGEHGRRVHYTEVVVKDGAHTIDVLRSIDNDYDIILVGRRLNTDSPLVAGLADWTYEPELGIIGDVLASADLKSTAPVLVIQQQSTVEDLLHIDKAKKLA